MSIPPDHHERKTDPASLRPSGESDHHAVAVPKMRPLPADLAGRAHEMPAPNPDSYVEMSIALLLHGLENQLSFEALLDHAVHKLNEDAEHRSATRTAEISANFELARHEVQRCLGAVEELRERVSELTSSVGLLAPRVGTVEATVDRLQAELTTLRTDLYRRVTHLEQEMRALQGKSATHPPAFPSVPPSSKPPKKTNPGK